MRTEIGNLTLVTADHPSKVVDSYTKYCYVCKKNRSNRVLYNPNPWVSRYEAPDVYMYYPGHNSEPNYTLGDIFLCMNQKCLDIILLLNAEKI